MPIDPESTLQPETPPIKIISVGALVAFALEQGDLTPGSFQPRDRAQAGTRGHQRVQRSRPEGYQTEVEIAYRLPGGDPPVEVRGRIDGLYPDHDPLILEEIKTTLHPLDSITENHNPLHWAQAQCYGAMLALQDDLLEVRIHLTYYQLDSKETKTFERDYSTSELEAHFNALLKPYLAWHQRLREMQARRDESIQALDFPYPAYRPQQRDMAVAVYKAIRDGERLYVQAPTGVGKTIAALFPAVKALGLGLVDKIFYLTAKTPGRLVAEDTLADMRRAGLRFKSVTLTAKEKICLSRQPDGRPPDCDPVRCLYARNYFGKLKTALAEIDRHEAFDRPTIEELARQHELCPFEFSLDLSLWVDIIICDYNYAFDPRVYLRRFFDFSSEAFLFLVDEAHNLPDRARSMYSAELDKRAVLALRRSLKDHRPALVKGLSAINKLLLEKRKACQAAEQRALVDNELPEDLLKAVREFSQSAEDWLALNRPAEYRVELLDFYFACLNYLRIADYFDSNYVSYFERRGKAGLLAKIFCLDPAPVLAKPLERAKSVLFFSATLLPVGYFQRLLTGDDDHPARLFKSPFPRENFRLLVHNAISTKYRQRAESYAPIADAIETICGARAGNYLVYFPSYAYMDAVLEQLVDRIPAEELLVQERGMSEEAREVFLTRFSADNEGTLIGFAVMGGIFGEGIDLVGERLIGAVVVGVGLPQICLEQDLIRDYFNTQGGHGFAYAYQYPGFNRVLQATGRVIRSESDRGIVVLIDERFTHSHYRRLFPEHWRRFRVVRGEGEIREALGMFWGRG